MDHVDRNKKDYDSAVKRLNSLDIDKLTKDFNGYSCSVCDTPKNNIIKELKNNG